MTKLVYLSWLAAVGSLNVVFLRTTETQDTFISLFGAGKSWFGALRPMRGVSTARQF